MRRLRKNKVRKFCGLSWNDMDYVLETVCNLEDDILITEEEQEALDIAIQCITQIMNRMEDGRKINWDD